MGGLQGEDTPRTLITMSITAERQEVLVEISTRCKSHTHYEPLAENVIIRQLY